MRTIQKTIGYCSQLLFGFKMTLKTIKLFMQGLTQANEDYEAYEELKEKN